MTEKQRITMIKETTDSMPIQKILCYLLYYIASVVFMKIFYIIAGIAERRFNYSTIFFKRGVDSKYLIKKISFKYLFFIYEFYCQIKIVLEVAA